MWARARTHTHTPPSSVSPFPSNKELTTYPTEFSLSLSLSLCASASFCPSLNPQGFSLSHLPLPDLSLSPYLLLLLREERRVLLCVCVRVGKSLSSSASLKFYFCSEMPVAPQSSQHSSLFSSIRRAIQPSSHHNPSAVAPDPPAPSSHSLSSSSSSSSTSSLSSSSHDPHRLQLYDVFESNLVQRLSSLSPMEDSTCVNMASLKQFLQVLLATQDDLTLLLPSHQFPLSQAQNRMMEEFLERSVKLLDVCRAIKEQISDVESSQGMLHLVLLCLSSKNGGVLHPSQVARARRVLGEMLHHMEVDEEVTPPVHLYRSFRLKCSDSCPDAPQRWRSWHGNARSSVQTNIPPSRQLQAIGSILTIPKLSAGDVEENLCAAIYTLNILSIFFLGTLSTSLPSPSKTYVTSFAHPRSFPWASPLSHLQEKVQEELKWRGKKNNGYVGMWELDQIATIVKRLFELTDNEDFSLGDKAREEIKNLVKQLRQHVEEVDRELGLLYARLMDFYGRIISSRMEILDLLSKF